MLDPEEKGILKGVNDLIDSALKLKTGLNLKTGKTPRHSNKTSCRQLTESPLSGFDASILIAGIYDQIGANWDASDYHKKSEENWRLKKQKGISPNNDSPEVSLEREIVNIPVEIWPDSKNWFNQVPIASGLVGPNEGGRRIDLVHDCGDGVYEFIELKVGSNTPLYAAMEILKCGILYIFCRQDKRASEYVDRKGELLQAEKIQLRVLAPAKYYVEYDLSWLEQSIDSGLANFLTQRKFAFEMDFKFSSWSLVPICSSPVTWRAWT